MSFPMLYLKGKFTQKFKIQLYTHLHADGKSSEVLLSTKTFLVLHSMLHSPEQLKQMGTKLKELAHPPT